MIDKDTKSSVVFTKVSLQNFKCHENLEFNFVPSRFVLVTGPNGSGKTSIFSAISWALYDETLEGISADDIVRKRSNGNTCVTVEWMKDKDNYKVVAYRKHKEYKNSRFIFKNGKDISGVTQKDTLKIISDLIMPKDVFFNCLLFSQYVKKHFLDLTNSGRMEILELILDLKRYDIYLESMKTSLSSLVKDKESVIYHKKLLEEKVNFLTKSINEENLRITDLENEKKNKLQDLVDRINILKGGKAKADLELENLKHFLDDLKVLEAKQSELSSKLDLLKNELSNKKILIENNLNSAKAEKKMKLNNEYLEKTSKLKDEKSNLENLKYQLLEQKSKIERDIVSKYEQILEEMKNEYDLKVSYYETKLNTLKNQIHELSKDQNSNGTNCESLRKEKNTLEDGLKQKVPICGVCKQPLNSKHLQEVKTRIEEINFKLFELEKNIELITEKKNSLVTEYENLDSEFSSFKKSFVDSVNQQKNLKTASVDLETKNIVSQIQDIELKINNTINTANTLKKEYENKVAALEDVYKTELKLLFDEANKQYEYESQNLITEIQKISEELKLAQNGAEEYNKMNEIRIRIDEGIQKLESNKKELVLSYDYQIGLCRTKITETRKELDDIRIRTEEFDEMLNEYERKSEVMNFWIEAFSDSGIRSMVLDEIVPFLNLKVREYCERIPLKISFNTQAQLKSGDFRNRFNINVLQTRNLSSLSELSSGEKRMVDIIIMLCLRELLEESRGVFMNIVLLDELLDTLDEENVSIVLDMLKQISQDRCVTLITHTLRSKNLETDGYCEMYKLTN